MHNDIWNGVRFFLTVNGIILAGFAALLRSPLHDYFHAAMLVSLPVLGILVTLQARFILSQHRRYYVSMLAIKTLIEKQLGFYDFHLWDLADGKYIDLSFPWQVDRQYLDKEFIKDVPKWRTKHETRPNLISTRLFNIYSAVIGLHVGLCFVVLLYSFYILTLRD